MNTDNYALVLALAGVCALLAAWLPAFTSRRPLSMPMVLVGAGIVIFGLTGGLDLGSLHQEHRGFIQRATELLILVALMGAGLRIDRPLSWARWSLTWRLVGIAMPITMLGVGAIAATIGGFAGASALLLAAALAPTDPVLASDVQVGEPTLDGPVEPDEDSAVRFALTSEGGLNDAFAFPFVLLAVAAASQAELTSSMLGWWVAADLLGRTVIGVGVGWGVGRLLGIVAFRPPGRLTALADTPQGFVAIAATLLAYGSAEVMGGYGFLAVFVAAVTLRGVDRWHPFHGALDTFMDQTENLFVVAFLVVLGGAVVDGALAALDWRGALLGVLVIFVVRPVAGLLCLVGSGLARHERGVIAFFGIRGFASVYYVAFATGTAAFPQEGAIWAIVVFTLLLSIVVHGVAATPAMTVVDQAVRKHALLRLATGTRSPDLG